MMRKESPLRLFFALWPDTRVRAQLASVYQHLPHAARSGRAVHSDNLHLTLHFLGSMERERVACFREQALKVCSDPFKLEFDRLGYFPRPRVLWLGPSKVPTELKLLHQRLNQRIAECGYSADKRPFSPHITLARKTRQAAPDPTHRQSILWEINSFALVQSISVEQGVRYEPIETFILKSS